MSEYRIVDRKESMSPDGRLMLFIEPDGDVIVAVYPDPNETSIVEDMVPMASIQICTPFSGGGGSPRTHKALLDLFDAMILDNADEQFGHRRGEHPGKLEWIMRAPKWPG